MRNHEEAGATSSTSLPNSSEISGEEDPTRKRILIAIQRVLGGYPKFSAPGATSVSALAKEAQVGRHHLYQNHSDLKDRYEFLRDRSDQPTQKEEDLRRRLEEAKVKSEKMRVLQLTKSAEAANWKAFAEELAQVINVLQEQVHQEQIKGERLERRLAQLQKEAVYSPSVVLINNRRSFEAEHSLELGE